MNTNRLTDVHLKTTKTLCPHCRTLCPGEVVTRGQDPAMVVLKRNCEDHGLSETLISSDARFYHLAKGDPINSCCGGSCSPADEKGKCGTVGSNAHPGDKSGRHDQLSTCVALIEIVNSCNLECPTCFASSPRTRAVDAVPLEQLIARIDGIAQKKGIELLQLSGGEPTLHPQFFELLEWVRTHPKIEGLLVNTNGVLIATDDVFAAKLREMQERYLTTTPHARKIHLYLQFDGPQQEGQQLLRGADLRKVRDKVITRCGEYGIQITLAMTVSSLNLPYMWETVQYGIPHAHVEGVSFQPMFLSGRNPGVDEAAQRLNTADIILNLVSQAQGQMSFDDFTPLPCGDPNCATIGWLARHQGNIISPSSFGINLPALQAMVPNRINYNLKDLEQCGCDTTELGSVVKQMEIPVQKGIAFRLFIKPFMDPWTWDEDRIDRCCTHVIRPDGKLDSFCRYYAAGGHTANSRSMKPKIDLALAQ